MIEEVKNIKEVGFTVDAGLIQRLGYELVGHAETAVAELIKNSYDADATVVNVQFKDVDDIGGTLIISDNGTGMNENQLLHGFMRISSTEKVHNPISERYHRTRAGRKGIGRFATQRLGSKLTIITQVLDQDYALKIEIDWERYNVECDLTDIQFPLEKIDKEKCEGTKLIIENLRERWTPGAIKDVYRYISNLLQPDYLSDRNRDYNVAIRNENIFKVNILNINDADDLNSQTYIFDNALAIMEGYIGDDHDGFITISSKNFKLDDTVEVKDLISLDIIKKENIDKNNPKYKYISNIRFKIYYYIYYRKEYYVNSNLSSKDLSNINTLSKTASGVRLYRNGFRVLPYGEPTNDWTKIDRRWSNDSGTNVPMANKNLYGFVEIYDPNGIEFEETASREGLIENNAFEELTDFLHQSLAKFRERMSEAVEHFKKNQKSNPNIDITESSDVRMDRTNKRVQTLANIISTSQLDLDKKEVCEKILDEIHDLLDESEMLRVLAGLGLAIGEFTHEIKQYNPKIVGLIYQLNQISSGNAIPLLEKLHKNFNNLFSYTKFFSMTISNNLNREKLPVDLIKTLELFKDSIESDLQSSAISLEIKKTSFDVVTIPMHNSEWSSILINLYTNARKAIKRVFVSGKILIEVGVIDTNIYLKFQDNGDGIEEEKKERIFNAFYSTSIPASFSAPNNEQLIGTGLGLKIVKDIVLNYNGSIKVVDPSEGYSTCIEILIPKN